MSGTLEERILKSPDEVAATLSQSNLGDPASQEVRRLIRVFDSKPFVCKCTNANCSKRATRCTVYRGNSDPYYWCDDCDPCSLGASEWKIQAVRTYEEAIDHVTISCNGRKRDLRDIIRKLATAKGLPIKANAGQIAAFFR